MNHNIDPQVLDDLSRAVAGGKLSDEAVERLLALRKALSTRPLLFKCPTPGLFLLGDPDNPVALDCDIQAAAGIQLALANPGRTDLVRVADFAKPGAAYPGNSVGNGRNTFAELLEAKGQRAVASEVRRVTVKGAYLVAPSHRRFHLVTE